MSRLDVRIKTSITATMTNINASANDRCEVYFKELSIGAGVFVGRTILPKTQISFDMELPMQGRVKIQGIILKATPPLSVVVFYYPEKESMNALWSYLRQQPVREDLCPYCGRELARPDDSCTFCGQYLRFKDDGYLDRHLLATFTSRAQTRIKGLEANFVRRLISLMDTELLDLRQETGEEEFVGTTPNILAVFSMIRRAAGTDMNILILGESGTGKELTAQAIHEKSLRKDKPFIVVNCAAIPDGLLEAELFGYEKGAFTGAGLTKKGRFELADSGTIFLDEIGDLSHGLQAKLLRFLEDHKIERVGGKSSRKVDIRIIAATNCDLVAMVDEGRFRNDLFFRLNSFTITLPPLRERGNDKIILAKYFFRKFSRIEQSCLAGFSDAALRAIQGHEWPGNVRELVNKVRRGLIMAKGEYIEPADMELKDHPLPAATQVSAPDDQRQQVCIALQENHFIISHAAKALQVSRPTLYSLIKRYHINVTDPERSIAAPNSLPGN